MLRDLFPKAWRRYSSVPLLGSSLVEFAPWLIEKGYTRSSRRQKLMAAARVDRYLRRRGLRHVSKIAREHLEACWRRYCQRAPNVSATARVLGRFLQERGLLPPRAPEPQTPSWAQADAYAAYLREIRGMGEWAIRCHVLTVRKFLQHIDYDRDRLCGSGSTGLPAAGEARLTTPRVIPSRPCARRRARGPRLSPRRSRPGPGEAD